MVYTLFWQFTYFKFTFFKATIHNLMKYIKMIEGCQAHLPMQYTSNIEFISQKWHCCCDWQQATLDSHWLILFQIMNTLGLLQSKWSPKFHEQTKNWIYYLYLHFILSIKYQFSPSLASFPDILNQIKHNRGFAGGGGGYSDIFIHTCT